MLVKAEIVNEGIKVTPGNPALNPFIGGTVTLKEVTFDTDVCGEVVETYKARIAPKTPWRRVINVNGKFVDSNTKEPVTNAAAVYMFGQKILYRE